MRLDATTLTARRFDQLIDALMEIEVLRTPRGREDVLGWIRTRWAQTIEHHSADRRHVIEIWQAADTEDNRREFFSAIEFIDPGSAINGLPRVYRLVDEATAFVAANESLYPVINELVDVCGTASAQDVASWINKAQSGARIELDAGLGLNARTTPFRDLLLTLGNYPARPDGSSFPLFFVVEGLAGESLEEPALARVREILDEIARLRGVTDEGIARLRADSAPVRRPGAAVLSPRARRTPQDPSILVRIDPDLERRVPAHYVFRVYDWQPWENGRVAADMGSTGRATNPSDRHPSMTREQLLSSEPGSAIGLEIGRRLMQTAMPLPLVEFLVPCALIGEPFDGLLIDYLGDGQLLVPLGTVARVVMRPLERWEPQFLSNPKRQRPVVLWRHRWQRVMAAAAGPLRAWLWKSGVSWSAVPGMLGTAQQLDVGCVGVAFVPATQEKTAQVYGVILAAGAPIALWMRSGDDATAEQVMVRIIDALEPLDMRDRVHGERVNAAAATGAPGGLTLVWDDPDRPPVTVDG